MTRSGGSATKRVAILGSSGGNLHSHGGHDPAGLLADIARQLEAAGITLAAVQFVAAESSMDHASDDTAAALWTLGSGTPERAITGTLAEVNEAARAHDERVAELVRSGEVDGLVLVSADPDDTNSPAVAAAAERGAPAAGTPRETEGIRLHEREDRPHSRAGRQI